MNLWRRNLKVLEKLEISMAAISFLVFFTLFHPVFLLPLEPENDFAKRCPFFDCGNSRNISFPLTIKTESRTCGPFLVDDSEKEHPQIQLDWKSGKRYQLNNIGGYKSQGFTVSVTDMELQSRLSSQDCKSFDNIMSLPELEYAESLEIKSDPITLYKCSHPAANPTRDRFGYNYTKCGGFNIFYNDVNKTLPALPVGCSVIRIPANSGTNYQHIFEVLTASFSFSLEVALFSRCYQCHLNRGKCPPHNSTTNWQCVHANETSMVKPKNSKEKRRVGKGASNITSFIGSNFWLLGFGCPAAVLVILILVTVFWNGQNTKDNKTVEVFLQNHGLISLKRYKYAQIKKMTGSFNNKLGQGAYASVFKGKLPDGSLVAVKILKELSKNQHGEEFMNEVASISRTSHVNIVALLGFCFEGSKQALIYEFMSNGSLDKYIYEEASLKDDRQLGWYTLYKIALGIARGLEYLHQGCSIKNLHFDIKPHNILLDENFSPKISDFGLSKICPGKESIVSTLGARGTAGYIAPELCCRNFGGISHKSDVYSYGMLVLEMVGGRRNLSITVDRASQIYFSDWIFQSVEQGEDLGLHGIDSEENNQIARKLVLVSLWCIETDPSNRPPMSRVIEMLQGNPESLPIPSKPRL